MFVALHRITDGQVAAFSGHKWVMATYMHSIRGLVGMDNFSTDSRPTALLTPREVSAILRVPDATLTAWRYRATGPRWIRVGRYVRYRPRDVDAWLDAQTLREAA